MHLAHRQLFHCLNGTLMEKYIFFRSFDFLKLFLLKGRALSPIKLFPAIYDSVNQFCTCQAQEACDN